MIIIDGHKIGSDFKPFVIAEMSANHNGNIESAFEIIKMAKMAGASAVKLQTYTADTITINCDSDDFIIDGGLWGGLTLHQLYSKAYTPWNWHKELFEFARKVGITIFSTPFDYTSVDFLEDLNTPAYKIASFEAIDLPLIKYVAQTGKPLIISTGMATEQEIEELVNVAYESGCSQLALLHCVSSYPAPANEYNLRVINDLRRRFNCEIGLSDHTLSNSTAIASIALGASLIEKHFTIDRTRGGPDDDFSIEPSEFSDLVLSCNTAWEALGSVVYNGAPSEISSLKFRRSLYFIKDLNEGEIIDSSCVRSIRPGYGLPPKFLDMIIGKSVVKPVKFGTPVNWSLLK